MRSLLTLLVVSTTTFNFAFANTQDTQNDEEFAIVSTRDIPMEDLQLLNQTRCEAMADDEALDIQEGEDETLVSIKKEASLLNKQGSYYTTNNYPGAQHIATFFSPDGRIVEMEDESQWLIVISDVAKASKWLTNDLLQIFPNKDFFWKTTNYKITNLNTRETISVDLIRGPKLNSYYTKYVSAIDLYTDSIYLNDGTRWDISWTDSSITRHWMPNDVVIVGNNCGWFSSSYPNILINVSLNQYVAAIRVY